MAAPSPLTLAASGTNGTATTSHSVSLPAGTADKVIFFLAFDSAGLSAPDASATGWTVAKSYAITQSQVLYVLTRAATSETSVTITTVESSYAAWVGGSTDGDIANAVFSTGATGSGSTNDPDEVTVPSGDYRGAALVAYQNGSRAINSYPTDYTDNQVNPRIAGSSRPGLGLATRGLTGITSEDPGAFGMHGGSGGNIAATMAIPEASGGTQGLTGTLFTKAPTFPQGTVEGGGTVLAGTLFTKAPTFHTGVVDTGYPGGLPEAAVIGIWDARSLEGSDTDPVASWPDIGPNSQNALAQATSAKQPTISDVSGRRWVLFDGSDDILINTLDQSYGGDFAIILVTEPLTYPTDFAAVLYSTGFIGSLEKNILGVDGVESGWPDGAWVVMSGPEGTQAEHHHGTAFTLSEDLTSTRFIMTQLVRNAGEHKLWENTTLVINESDSAQGDSLNNLAGMRLGMREDESRPAHMRVGYLLLVDMSEATETQLLDARDALAAQFEIEIQSLGGQRFTSTPTFPQGTVAAGAVTLTGTLFSKAPTFGGGTIGSGSDLAGSVFQSDPTFGGGTIDVGAVDLAGTVFEASPTFGGGTVAAEGDSQTLTGTLFQRAPTFGGGSVAPGEATVTGQVFEAAPSFHQGDITATYQLSGTLLEVAPTFGSGAVDTLTTIDGNLLAVAPTFPTGTLSFDQALTGTVFVSDPSFGVGSLGEPVDHPVGVVTARLTNQGFAAARLRSGGITF